MKLKSILFIPIILSFFSCDNEFNINSEWRDITVLYGLLNPNADTNFIRIERGYLGTEPARNSFDEPDSLYYHDLHVVLNWYNITNQNGRGNLVGSVELAEDFTSRQLDSNGPFTTQGYRLYRIPPETPITSDYEYEVVVEKPDGGPTVTANTRVVENFTITRPIKTFGNPLTFNGLLRWDNIARNIELYQPYFYFYYREYDMTTGQSETKVIKYQYPNEPAAGPGNNTDYEKLLSSNVFYTYIANRLDDDPNKLRFFEKMTFEVWGANENLVTYMNLNKPTNEINQNRPEFTNIQNGTGIFASRIRVVLDGVALDDSGSKPTFEDDLYRKNSLICGKRFAYINTSGDTCICNPNPGEQQTTICF